MSKYDIISDTPWQGSGAAGEYCCGIFKSDNSACYSSSSDYGDSDNGHYGHRTFWMGEWKMTSEDEFELYVNEIHYSDTDGKSENTEPKNNERVLKFKWIDDDGNNAIQVLSKVAWKQYVYSQSFSNELYMGDASWEGDGFSIFLYHPEYKI